MKNPAQNHSHSHMGMMVLCVALMGGAVLFFSRGGQEGTLSLSILAPLLICVGAHFLMHRFMGHDCDKTGQNNAKGAKELTVANTKSIPSKVSAPNRTHTA